MNYTHLMNLAGQGIAIGNNFCVLSGEDISNDESEIGNYKRQSPNPIDQGTVGTQSFVTNLITKIIRGNQD